MNSTQKEEIQAAEAEVDSLLDKMSADDKTSGFSIHDPIYDGVVDVDFYLDSHPKILWILKEPWEPLAENEAGGGWSLTKHLIPKRITEQNVVGIPTYRKMAYVSFAVFDGFKNFSDFHSVRKSPQVGESLKKIAYINVKKYPGKSVSYYDDIEFHCRRNHDLLQMQIAALKPDVIIAGAILHLFYNDFGITRQDLTSAGTCAFISRNGRLYINAYHPSYWGCDDATYVDDVVTVIKNHCPQSSIANLNS
jgi:hypothetical protein